MIGTVTNRHTATFLQCPFNQWIECPSAARSRNAVIKGDTYEECERCSWNPEEYRRRRAMLRDDDSIDWSTAESYLESKKLPWERVIKWV